MALMKKHQMDITEFSEKCGIKEERVERLLGGRGKPSHLERMCIAEAFGMTEEELQDIEPLSQTEVREVQTDGIEKVIAERLQEIVKIHGIGIPELAERCGLKRQRAKKLMNGEVKMSIAEAVSIANEFQVSLEYLLGRYPYPLPAPRAGNAGPYRWVHTTRGVLFPPYAFSPSDRSDMPLQLPYTQNPAFSAQGL